MKARPGQMRARILAAMREKPGIRSTQLLPVLSIPESNRRNVFLNLRELENAGLVRRVHLLRDARGVALYPSAQSDTQEVQA